MKGILLAGGTGTRMHPLTEVVSKQLLPIYDKPAIFYPLSVLMLRGIREILIISKQSDILILQRLFGGGEKLGLSITYVPQERPRGIAEAFLLARKFVGGDSVCLVLGDNLFYGRDLIQTLRSVPNKLDGAVVFACHVQDPRSFGVVELDGQSNPLSIEEKPQQPRSNWAVPGLYFYDNEVLDVARQLIPSDRGELEITDVNRAYLSRKKLKVVPLGRGFTWMDVGTPDSLLEASSFVQSVEKRQGLKIACLEEIACGMGFISTRDLQQLAREAPASEYGRYLRMIASKNDHALDF